MRLIASILAVGLVVPTVASAQTWQKASPRLAKAGIVAQQIRSFEGNTAGALLRCLTDQREFILVDASGETHDGASIMKIGSKSFPIAFKNDPQLRQALGIPGSWAAIPQEAVDALVNAGSVVLDNQVRTTTGQSYVSTIKVSMKGFPGVWKSAAGACRPGARPAASNAAATPTNGASERSGALPAVVARARDSYARECASMGGRSGQFRAGGILSGDFNGDGITDYVLDLNKYECRNGPTGAGYCGSQGCSIDVFVSNGGGHKQDGWMGMYGAAIVKAPGGDRIRLDGHRGAVQLKWNGRSFVPG